MAETLRDRIRDAADEPAPTPQLKRVVRRARVIRARRYASAALAVTVALAGISVPIYALHRLGEAKSHRRVPTGPTFGDGRVSFEPIPGWTVLQGGTISACATTATFAREDLAEAQSLGPDVAIGCGPTEAALPPDGVLITAWATDGPYIWAQPNINFPAGTIPPTLDPSTCGTGTYEGTPAGTTECRIWMTANDRALDIRVFLKTESPSSDLLATAQRGLDALQVSEPASLGNDIAFEPAEGWHDQAVPTTGDLTYALPAAWTSNVALAPYSGDYLPAGPSNDDIANLPPDGVIVSAEQWISTRNPLPETADFPPLTLPLHLSDARLIPDGWEGMAISDVSQLYMRGVVNGRPIIVQAFFRTADPDPDLVKEAQIGLNRLVVVRAPPPRAELDDFGIGMDLPDGWHGWLYAGDPTLVATTSVPTNPFYAPEVGRQMGPSDISIVLDESDGLQDLRWPAIEGPPQIGPDNLCEGCEVMDDGQPPAEGHVLYRDTFTTGGRAFDLYVEFGSTPSEQQLADANAILGTLCITSNPSPEPPPPGGTAVGSLPDGQHPAVGTTDANRTLSWTYEGNESISVPEGWTGWINLVVDSAEPLNVLALGSWVVPQGAYCAPITALSQLPPDGVLIWIDRYEQNTPPSLQPVPWPASPTVGPGTDPSPVPTPCTAGTPVQSFSWMLGGRTFAVHVAFGPHVSDANLRAADAALASFGLDG